MKRKNKTTDLNNVIARYNINFQNFKKDLTDQLIEYKDIDKHINEFKQLTHEIFIFLGTFCSYGKLVIVALFY